MNWICPLLAASFVVGLLIASFFVIFRGRRKASGNSNQPGLTSNLESKVAFDHIVLSKIFQKPRRQKVLFGSNMDNVDNELEAPQLSLPTLLLDGVPGRRLKLPELEPLSPDDLLQPQSRPPKILRLSTLQSQSLANFSQSTFT